MYSVGVNVCFLHCFTTVFWASCNVQKRPLRIDRIFCVSVVIRTGVTSKRWRIMPNSAVLVE